jgi:transcriptional regulator with XRE-family HTH domain
MDVRARVGLNLQRLRREKNFSQEELAHAANVHQTYISDLERGKRNPSILVLDRLAGALSVDLADLCAPPTEREAYRSS